jgi:hypothetical protein
LRRGFVIAAVVVAAVLVVWLATFLVFGAGDESGPTISSVTP